MTYLQTYSELYERCLKTSKEMQDLAEKLNKITDSNEKFNARRELEGLLGKNDEQLDKLEYLSNVIIANKSLRWKISKHYKFSLDTAPAIILDRLQNLTDSYVHISLLTVKDDLDAYVKQKTEQTGLSF